MNENITQNQNKINNFLVNIFLLRFAYLDVMTCNFLNYIDKELDPFYMVNKTISNSKNFVHNLRYFLIDDNPSSLKNMIGLIKNQDKKNKLEHSLKEIQNFNTVLTNPGIKDKSKKTDEIEETVIDILNKYSGLYGYEAYNNFNHATYYTLLFLPLVLPNLISLIYEFLKEVNKTYEIENLEQYAPNSFFSFAKDDYALIFHNFLYQKMIDILNTDEDASSIAKAIIFFNDFTLSNDAFTDFCRNYRNKINFSHYINLRFDKNFALIKEQINSDENIEVDDDLNDEMSTDNFDSSIVS